MHATFDDEAVTDPVHLVQLVGQGSQLFSIEFWYVIGAGQFGIHKF